MTFLQTLGPSGLVVTLTQTEPQSARQQFMTGLVGRTGAQTGSWLFVTR